jgi:hypothetical protein
MTDIDADGDDLDFTDVVDDIDRDALERCMEIAKRDPLTADLMAEKPISEAWETAAYHCQHTALNLKVWQEPPCRL